MKNLKSLIKELVKVDAENECVEFKENNSEPEMIGEYVSALSNSATYHDRQYAYLVWGVNDETHEYTDTTFNFRTKKGAENVYDMFRQGGTDDVREKLIDVMYENQKLREENTTLKELLEKAYEFMKQFVIDGVNLLERFLESVGKVIGKNKNK